jgi:hypothetical protein
MTRDLYHHSLKASMTLIPCVDFKNEKKKLIYNYV